jgi:C_GCAxxG_C_C family probable redox protein
MINQPYSTRNIKTMELSRSEKARQYFKEGYNCAQSTVLAFEDILPIPRKELLMLASGFGGGMAGMHEVCGAVTGAFMVIGLLYGFDSPKPGQAKMELYEHLRSNAEEFRAVHGSIICRELTGLRLQKNPDGTPKHDLRCADLIAFVVEDIEAQIYTSYIAHEVKVVNEAEKLKEEMKGKDSQ